MGTWRILEISKAIEKEYQVVKIHEVYHWPETTQYDPVSTSGGLFAGYVNAFLKVKQESSRWPDWCDTDADKNQYINQYREREGICLEAENIRKNP